MLARELKERYLRFFEKKGHLRISSASLVPENDATTLFTSSGMQQLVLYLKGKPHPMGKRLVDSQPSIRLQDIEEVGDTCHTTFFEMLGNWSLGDYFKEDQLRWVFEFLTDKIGGLGLNPKKLYVSVFDGNENFSVLENGKYQKLRPDVETIAIWKNIFAGVGINAKEGKRIFSYPSDKNWWSRSGTPEEMPVGEIGGPDSEIFFDFGEELKLHENSAFKNQECHPNCPCGRFLEIGNSVFMQYIKKDEKTFEELPNKNVDFGGGLERLTAVTNNNPDIFQIDLFMPIIQTIEQLSGKSYQDEENKKAMRIIADHLRAAVFLISDGVVPSNVEQGYVLRRLIRRAIRLGRRLQLIKVFTPEMSKIVIQTMEGEYPELEKKSDFILETLYSEEKNFSMTLEKGISALKKIFGRAIGEVDPEDLPKGMIVQNNIIRVDGSEIFHIYTTYGVPPELSQEIMTEWGLRFDDQTMKKCNEAFKRHQKISRAGAEKKFVGGLIDHSEKSIKYHTAAHLLHAAARKILGESARQAGQNITAERLRFDLTIERKITPEEIVAIEKLVNEKIAENLPVVQATKTQEEARQMGAIGLFTQKYGDKVSVYSIGDFSREFCAGPHTDLTGSIGRFKIIREESAGRGIRRIYAQIS